jgi:hypothetical protein
MDDRLVACNGILGMPQMRQEHARTAINRLDNHAPLGRLERQSLSKCVASNLEKALGKRQQIVLRQPAVTALDGLQQGVRDADSCPQHGGLRDAELLGEFIGGLEADTTNVPC